MDSFVMFNLLNQIKLNVPRENTVKLLMDLLKTVQEELIFLGKALKIFLNEYHEVLENIELLQD